jgi:3-hydroxybutyryl-CoA dehydrogenase
MTVGICGAGTMGRGIAVACLQAGLQVLLYDIRSEVLQKASQAIAQLLRAAHERGKLAESPENALQRLRTVTTLAELIGCDLIVEAIVENRSAKQELFRALESLGSRRRRSLPATPLRSRLRRWRRCCTIRSDASGCTSSTPPM